MFPVLWGIALGAAGAYIFDPQTGARRRALARDKIVHGVHRGRDFADAAARDLRHRVQGATASMHALRQNREAPAGILVARARARMGRFVSHPRAIQAEAHGENGILLSGDVLASERDGLLRAVRSVRGIDSVEDRLTVHETAANFPALQGGEPPRGQVMEFRQTAWSPGARVVSGGAGAALVVYALAHHGVAGALAGALGAALLLRTGANKPLARTLLPRTRSPEEAAA